MNPEDENQQGVGTVEETAPEEVAREQAEEAGIDEEILGEEKPSFAASVAEKAGAAAERTGAAARRLLEGLGSRLAATSSPPAAQSIVPEDDLSDLFEGPDMSRDNDVYIDDLVSVDDEDVFGDGGADMSDILEVTEEDLMGTEDYLGTGRDKVASQTRRPFVRVVPPTEQVSGLQ